MEKLLINTPQNVQIEYGLASIGNRMLAIGIDYILIVAYVYCVSYVLGKAYNVFNDYYTFIGIYSFMMLPALLYHFVFESMLGGQTPGKKIMKLKVVRLDGGRASIYEYFTRWALNIVDIWLVSGVIGMLSIILSKNSQRVGDMAAGTTVINLKSTLTLNQTVYENLASTYQPVYSEFEIRKLSDRDVNIIKQSLEDAKNGKNKDTVIETLAAKIEDVTGIKRGTSNNVIFIETVLKDHYHYHKDL